MMQWRKWWRIPGITFYGAAVYAHWSVLVAVVIVAFLSSSSPLHAAIAIGCYLSIVVIHEWGHAFVAHRLGYEVVAIRVAFLHGACQYEAPQTLWDEALVAWGGVAAQMLVAAAVLLVPGLLGNRDWSYFGPVLAFLGYVNLLLALANLAPGRGSDGSIAWRVVPLLFKRYRARRGIRKSVVRLVKRK